MTTGNNEENTIKFTLAGISVDQLEEIKSSLKELSATAPDEQLGKINRALSVAQIQNTLMICELTQNDIFRLISLVDFYNIWKTDNVKHPWNTSLADAHKKITKHYLRRFGQFNHDSN